MLLRIAAIVCLGGCSFWIAGADPNRPASVPPHCDTSKGRVVVDTGIAAVAGAVGLGLIGDHDGGAGAAMLLTSALFAGSALIGNGTVDRCRIEVGEYQLAAAPMPPPPAIAPVDPYAAAAPPPPPPPPLSSGDVFHVPVGGPPPPVPEAVQPRPPAPDPAWSQFWREAN